VTAEEVQALAGEPAASAVRAQQVDVRDFRAPLRLRPEQRSRHARSVARALPELEQSLSIWLRAPYRVDVDSVGEASAVEVLRQLVPGQVLLAFECAGRNAWALWDGPIAAAATEIALGATDVKNRRARTFSAVECGVLRSMLGRVIALVGRELEVEPKNVRVVQDEIQLELERTDAKSGDPQRLAISLALSGPIGDSVVRIYLAGVKTPDSAPPPPPPGAKDAKDKKKAAPEHLLDVPFELGAQLGATEVALSDLLGLEVGDVIPLNASAETGLTVYIDGVACGTARFGEHKGRLAIQLQTFGPQATDIPLRDGRAPDGRQR